MRDIQTRKRCKQEGRFFRPETYFDISLNVLIIFLDESWICKYEPTAGSLLASLSTKTWNGYRPNQTTSTSRAHKDQDEIISFV